MAAGLRSLGKVRGVERVIAIALRARLVRESGRFFARELLPGLGRDPRRVYHLRGSGVPILLEHHTPDAHTLDELWYGRVYDPPAAAGAALDALGAQPRVLDLGANVGMFVAWLVERHERPHVVAYEPDPRNAERLRLALLANEQHLGSWELRLGAAGAAARDLGFASGDFAASRAGDDSHVIVRCWDVLDELAGCDVLKMDIEGGEWEILRDPRFAACAARVVVVEPHAGGDAPADHVRGARELLEQAGYATEQTHGAPGEAATVWGWR